MRWILVVALVSACAAPAKHPSLTASPEVCHAARPFCLPARDLEILLSQTPLRILAREPVGKGNGDAWRLLAAIPGGPTVRLKWKPAAPGGDGYNHSPRRELAAYALQKLLLDESDYVIPPTVARCRELGHPPTFAGTRCVLGTLSYWIEGASELDGIDHHRFAIDPGYRRHVAMLNVVTHLIDHRDTKPSNFIVARDHTYSVDNGMAFSGWRTPRGWFRHEWQDLIVDSVPRDLISRLRKIRRSDLAQLATVAQFRVHHGGLEAMAPGAPFDPNQGVRRRGDIIQLGLTWSEIDAIEDRLEGIIGKVESGEVKLF